MTPKLMIVVPCYNEEEVLPCTIPLLAGELDRLIGTGKVSPDSGICFVDDGSADSTWRIIREAAGRDPRCRGISLSRNQGHQSALLAGLTEVAPICDISISIDCDGQDDVRAMEEMVDRYLEGYDVVYGVRTDRESDTFLKRYSAESFYKLLNRLGAEVVFNHADYRLMSSRALAGLAQFGESNLYLRGIVPMVGYPSAEVGYERAERAAGKSHYPLGKMAALAIDGITSLSTKPIRIISGMGFLFSIVGFIGIIWAIVAAVTGNAVSGWASTVCIVCLIGGVQLLSLGVIGTYVGKTYLETKRRPRFIVKERTSEQRRG